MSDVEPMRGSGRAGDGASDPGASSHEQQRRDWVRRLEEVSALAPDDEERRRVEEEVARLGGWAEARWLALLSEGQRWHLELSRMEPPAGLEASLEAIPIAHPRARGPFPARGRAARFAWIAATVFLVLSAALVVQILRPPSPKQSQIGDDGSESGFHSQLHALALLALNDHLNTHDLEHVEGDPSKLATWLGSKVGFAVALPSLPPSLQLLGGRKCTLGSKPVGFTSWQGEEGRLTLVALQAADFGMPEDMVPWHVSPSVPVAQDPVQQVLLWTQGTQGYVAVADQARDLEALHTWLTLRPAQNPERSGAK